MASTNAWMVVPGPLTSPVGLAEVMRILRLGPPRFRPFALPGPLRLLRLLMRFQLLRSDVNVVGKRRAGRGIYLRQTPEMRPVPGLPVKRSRPSNLPGALITPRQRVRDAAQQAFVLDLLPVSLPL